jgi:hypothetical protein
LAACLLSAAPAFAGEAQWVEVKSPHFSVVTDGGEKRGRDVAIRFEQMRAVFGTLFSQTNVNLPVPLQIVAFRNTKGYASLRHCGTGSRRKCLVCSGNTDRSFILLDLSVENPWAVVFHEYAHQLMDGNLSTQIDPWFEEGFAEYFASIEVDGKQARVGKIPEDTYRVLQQAGMMKTADLFRVQQNSRIYNESGDRRSGFYAQSAMVVHYIYDNNLAPKLINYFELADNKEVPVESAIQQAFGMTAARFDITMREYVMGGRSIYYRMPTPAGIVTTMSRACSAQPTAVRCWRACIFTRRTISRRRWKSTKQSSRQMRKINWRCADLATRTCSGRTSKKRGSTSSRRPRGTPRIPASTTMRHCLCPASVPLGNPPHSPVMTKELETSIALDPNYADAYSLLSFAYAYAGDPAKGLQTMRKAIALSPRNEGYIYNLAQM